MRQKDCTVRLELLQKHTREMKLSNDVDLNRIMMETEEFHEAHLPLICAEAEMVSKVEAFDSMREDEMIDFDKLDHIVVFDKHFTVAIHIIKHRSGNKLSMKYSSYENHKRRMKILQDEQQRSRLDMQIICGHVEQNTQGSTSDEMKEPKDKFGSTSDDKLGPNVGERVRSQQCFQETRRTNTNPLIVLSVCRHHRYDLLCCLFPKK